MASAKDLIDATVLHYDGVDSTDADNSNRRLMLLSMLQRVYEYVRNYREWEFTYTEASLTITINTNSVDLPADYLEFGRNGHLFDMDKRIKMKEETRYTLERLRQEVQSSIDYMFCIFGGAVQVPVNASANRNLKIFYRTVAETLTDDATPIAIPDRYCRLVLLQGLIFLAQESKNDARSDWSAQFRDGLSQMCALENPVKTGVRRMPYAVRGGW